MPRGVTGVWKVVLERQGLRSLPLGSRHPRVRRALLAGMYSKGERGSPAGWAAGAQAGALRRHHPHDSGPPVAPRAILRMWTPHVSPGSNWKEHLDVVLPFLQSCERASCVPSAA